MARTLDQQAEIALIATFAASLNDRCQSKCELCGGQTALVIYEVPPLADPEIDNCVMTCQTCNAQLEGEAALEEAHWKCLNDSAWSQQPAVQVTAWQTLQRLSHFAWAQELGEQIYLDESLMAKAQEGLKELQADDDDDQTVDSNGAKLRDGDTVQIIKDLDVKGTGFVAKRGTIVKSIRLTGNPEHVEGRVNKTAIVLKTCFLKKST